MGIKKRGRPSGFKMKHRSKQLISKSKTGQKPSQKTKDKIAVALLEKHGSKLHESYCDVWRDSDYRDDIKDRDGNICLNPYCNKITARLTTHHIDYNKQNWYPSNLITICMSCNLLANENREWHKAWYRAIMTKRYHFQYKDEKCDVKKSRLEQFKHTENYLNNKKEDLTKREKMLFSKEKDLNEREFVMFKLEKQLDRIESKLDSIILLNTTETLDILDESILEMPFSIRVKNALMYKNIGYIYQLTNLTSGQLLTFDNFGVGSLYNVRKVLQTYGLSLKE